MDEITDKFVKKITQIEESALDANISEMKEKEALQKLQAAETHARKVVDVSFQGLTGECRNGGKWK